MVQNQIGRPHILEEAMIGVSSRGCSHLPEFARINMGKVVQVARVVARLAQKVSSEDRVYEYHRPLLPGGHALPTYKDEVEMRSIVAKVLQFTAENQLSLEDTQALLEYAGMLDLVINDGSDQFTPEKAASFGRIAFGLMQKSRSLAFSP